MEGREKGELSGVGGGGGWVMGGGEGGVVRRG